MSELQVEDVVIDVPDVPKELPVLPLKETVVFPEAMTPLAIGQERSMRLIEDVVSGEQRMLALVTVREPEVETPGFDELYETGTAAIVHKMIRVPDGTLRILVQGFQRVRLQRRIQEEPYLVGEFEVVPDELVESKEVEALTRNVQALFARVIGLVPYLPEELQLAAANVDEPSALTHLVASTLRLKTEEKQHLLELVDVEERLREVSKILNRELEVFELGTKIQSQVQSEMEKGQREFFLRQQLKAIQDELGEGDAEQAEINELRERLDVLDLPEDIDKAARRELARLEKLPSAAAEYGVIRTYLEWIITLPWNTMTEDNLDLDNARRVLDDDHYDLDKVKDRIVEQLAVAKLRNEISGQILCFVGPPGVGKTSLGQSIARALGRKFVRLSVGGVRDEAEIRGHRRTYVGALPGRILQNMKTAGEVNPVFMLDEIDKVGADFRGDPSSALLEVLDPEQNNTFSDHYLEVPYDLSKVIFITTANIEDTIIAPLRDRMEIIRLPGYTEEEKLHIATGYLVPRQLKQHGLEDGRLVINDEVLRELVRRYTREAGVRNLEREIGTICRKVARAIAEGKTDKVEITLDLVAEYLGPQRFDYGLAEEEDQIGAATGVSVSEAGGDVLTVEATVIDGKDEDFTLTGQIGKVMEESARAALSYVRAHERDFGIPKGFFEDHAMHIHVPAGAIPKDGPSAGVTMATAIVSALSGRRVRRDVAMTGEITLRGRVLPIGGVKEKLLAAHRAGIKVFILPEKNKRDLIDIPKEVLDTVEIKTVDNVDQVLKIALQPGQPTVTPAQLEAATHATVVPPPAH